MNPLLALLIKDVVPGVIAQVKAHHALVNPDLPPLTNEEAEALLQEAVNATVAKDDNWMRAKGQV